MKKEFTINTLEGIYNHLMPKLAEKTKDIKLKTRSLYNLFALKRTLEERHAQTQEVVAV